MLGYYRSLRAFLSAGHNILADTGFYTPEILAECVCELSKERVWLVGVHCSLPELERREGVRGDRQPGLAKEQQATIHRNVLYDIEVETTTSSPDQCALLIKEKLQELGNPIAMPSLVVRLNVAKT